MVFPRNDVWETSAEIPYWWRVTTQTWIVLLTGGSKFPSRHVQSEALLRSVTRHQYVISVFFWRHVAGKPVVASWNVACFLKLSFTKTLLFHFRPVNRGILCPRNGWQSSSLAWSQVILISWAFYSRTATNGHFPIRGWFSYRTGTSVDDSARKSTTGLTNAERQIGHRKSSLVVFARFSVVKWRSRSVAKSA